METFSSVSTKYRAELDTLWTNLREMSSDSVLEMALLQSSTNQALLWLRLSAIDHIFYEHESAESDIIAAQFIDKLDL